MFIDFLNSQHWIVYKIKAKLFGTMWNYLSHNNEHYDFLKHMNYGLQKNKMNSQKPIELPNFLNYYIPLLSIKLGLISLMLFNTEFAYDCNCVLQYIDVFFKYSSVCLLNVKHFTISAVNLVYYWIFYVVDFCGY